MTGKFKLSVISDRVISKGRNSMLMTSEEPGDE